VVFLPNRPVIADKVMIGQAFRNASFDGGKVTLWVNRDKGGQAAGPAMSAMRR
jgi:hypothetical protein